MKSFKIFIFVLLISGVSAFGQSQKTLKADKLFDRFKFQEAIKVYKKLVRTDKKDRPYIYQKLGDAYATISQPFEAVKWYEKAVKNPEIEPVYYYRYAMALRQAKRYEESIEWMKKYKEKSGMSDTRLQEFFKELDIVEKVKKEGFKAFLINVPINSEFTEYGGTYYKDNQIVYTTNNINSGGKRKSSWDNLPFTDLQTATVFNQNEYQKNGSFSPVINTDFHESSPTFNKDFTVMYFTRNNLRPGKKRNIKNYNLKIYRSFFIDNKWNTAEEVHFNSNDYNCAHPVLSKDNKTLYFVSDMPGTYGKSDIYKVKVNNDWTLGTPENLGEKINTEGTETFPFVDKSGNLYFSSDGHAGLGGLDIFVAFYINGNFLMLKNLGLPYNSSKDDFAFVLNDNNQEGYISSNRLGGNGYDDIYHFTIKELIKPLIYLVGYAKNKNGFVIPDAKISISDSNNKEVKYSFHNGFYSFLIDPDKDYVLKGEKEGFYSDSVRFDTKTLLNPKIRKDLTLEMKKYLKTCVRDYETKKRLDSVEITIYTDNKRIITHTNSNGCWSYEIPRGTKEISYEMEFRKKEYLPQRLFYNQKLDNGVAEYWIKPNKEDVELLKLILKPIYFDLDKSYIRPDAAAELDKLVELLNKYPSIEISMESHTDSRGSDKYNEKLSERRAQSTMQYLIDHGIDPNRLRAKGFGENRLTNRCSNDVKCSEKEHQQNRRTEFVIIKM